MATRLYKVNNINWDTDGEDVDLPKTMVVEVDTDIVGKDEEDIEEYISDYITDETGFCHKGFNYYAL